MKVKAAASLITKDFSLDKDELASCDSLDELKLALTRIVNYLLNKDLGRLLNALYRIDISESKVKVILASTDPDEIGKEIAQLIVERELQKVATREKYRST